MAIRKVQQQPKVAQKQTIPDQQDALAALKGQVDRALKDGNFSQKETRDLQEALKARPDLKAGVGAHLQSELQRLQDAGTPVSVSEVALSKLGQSVGLDLKELFFRRQAQSGVVDHEVAQGLDKTAKTVGDEHDVGKHKAASDTRLDMQKAILDGKKGVVDRPVGGAKGKAYDAAVTLAEHVEGKLDEHLGVEAKAAKDVLREPLISTGTAVVAEMKRGDTLKKLGDAVSTFGKPGFGEALSDAASSVGGDIVNATHMTAVDTDAVKAFVGGTTSTVDRLSALTKGTKLEAAVAQHGGKLVEGVTELGAKVTQGAKVATEGAKVASTASTAAQVGTAAAEGAQVATAGAEAAGQTVPIVGQALGVVTTGLATAEFIGHCRGKPKDWKRIVSAGANLIGQAVGVFIPFVGAATTAGKLAADAAMNAHDKKAGREPPQVGLGQVAPHVDSATSLLSPFLDAAGYGDAAGKLRNYNEQLKKLGDKGVSSTEFAQMKPAERDEMMQMLAAAGLELEKVAPEAKGTPYEASATLLGEGFRQLMGLWRKSKNIDAADDPEAEKKKAAGEAMEAAAKATVAEAAANTP